MNATDGTDSSAGSKELSVREYFNRIEYLFIELRGAPLLLGPDDYQVAKGWREDGIPLDLVEETLRDLFARREKQGDDRLVTLKRTRRSVAAAWKKQQKLQAPAADVDLPDLSVVERLASLAARIPPDLAEPYAARIRALAGDPQDVERELAVLDAELIVEISSSWSADEMERFEAEWTQRQAALGTRLPAAEMERAADRLRAALVREWSGLPVLSLFH